MPANVCESRCHLQLMHDHHAQQMAASFICVALPCAQRLGLCGSTCCRAVLHVMALLCSTHVHQCDTHSWRSKPAEVMLQPATLPPTCSHCTVHNACLHKAVLLLMLLSCLLQPLSHTLQLPGCKIVQGDTQLVKHPVTEG